MSRKACCALFMVFTSSASAEGFSFSGSIAASTDYIWRGKSQTQNHPAISGSLGLAYEYYPEHTVYVGVWSSNVDFDDGDFESDTSFEVDLYAGFNGIIDIANGIAWDLGWLRYEYPGDTQFNYNEAYASLGYSPIDAISFNTKFYYGMRIEHRDPGNYAEINLNIQALAWVADDSVVAFLKDVNVMAHGGFYDKENPNHTEQHVDWAFAISKNIIYGINTELRYTDSDIHVDSLDDAHLVFTISKQF